MKIICILLLTVGIISAQYAGSAPQSNSHQYGNARQPIPPPQPARASQPRDNRSIGMSYQAPPPDQNSMFIEAFMNMFFEQMKDVHMDRYETEDGVLTNVNIHVKPPTPGNLVFRYQEKEDKIYFFIKGLGASVEANVDLFYGTIQGYLKLSIENLDVDLRTDPTKLNNIDAMHIDYRLHLNDADIKADLTALKDTTLFPSGFDEVGSLVKNVNGNYKIVATKVLDDTFSNNSGKIIKEFLGKLSNEYLIPTKRSLGDSKFVLKSEAQPFRLGENQSIIVDFDTSAYITKTANKGIKESLLKSPSHFTEKSKILEASENKLFETQNAINDNRHHILIAPHLVKALISNFDPKLTSFKLEDQAKLQQQVNKYFGGDVELECYPHENEFPEYRSLNNAITGDQKVKCSLHKKGNRQESIFDIDLRLNFEIHPEVDKNGKTVKGEFGSIQTTEINQHEKNMEIKTTLSDKMQPMNFNPASFDFNLPFLMNQANMKIQNSQQDKLEKFQELLSQNIIIDVEQLERDILPSSFNLPLPEGYRFTNPSVKIHENGVIDISGDLAHE